MVYSRLRFQIPNRYGCARRKGYRRSWMRINGQKVINSHSTNTRLRNDHYAISLTKVTRDKWPGYHHLSKCHLLFTLGRFEYQNNTAESLKIYIMNIIKKLILGHVLYPSTSISVTLLKPLRTNIICIWGWLSNIIAHSDQRPFPSSIIN
jgi:hypothetical protein